MHVLVKGPTGSGKTANLQEEYQNLIRQSIRTDKILVLVRNRRQSILWREKIDIKMSAGVRIQTYFGFVQNEIKKYWPMIRNCIKNFKSNMIEPIFLTTEISQFLLAKQIEEYRLKGKLIEITANSQRIAIEGLAVLSQIVTSGKTIEQYKTLNENLTNDLRSLLTEHIDDCMARGYIDYYIALEIYNDFLLKNEEYLKSLRNGIEHLVVDGLEDAVASEIDFIDTLLETLVSSKVAFSTDGTYSKRQGACPEYAEKTLFNQFDKVVELKQHFNCDQEFFELSEQISQKVITNSGEIIKNSSKMPFLQAELRSEMIKEISGTINELFERGYKPSEIAIICPIVDSVLEYCLQNDFKKKEMSITNIARTNRYIDQSFIKALITLACLSHPMWDLNPPEHDIATLISMVLGLDPIRGSLIAREVVKQKPFTLPGMQQLEFRQRIGFNNSEKYDFLKIWIENYRTQEPLTIDVFLQKAFTNLLIQLPLAESNMNICQMLIESATRFINTYQAPSDIEKGKAFIELIKQGIKPAETILDLEKKLYTKDIIISTPQAYISSSFHRKVQVWTDVSSSNWHKSDVAELSNPYVLSPLWEQGREWNSEDEEKHKMLKLGAILKKLIRSCPDRILLSQSQYSQDGYENSGVLSEIFS
jgi:hypothetical protein